MDRSTVPLLVLVATATALAAGTAAGAAPPDATIDIPRNESPTASYPNGTLTLHDWTPGQRWKWNLTTPTNYTRIEVRIDEGFNVTRGAQLVPLVGGRHFVELPNSTPASVDRPADVYNLTAHDDASDLAWTYRLGVNGTGETNLTLHRDVDPPGYKLGEPRNVTHVGFHLTTTTTETALATIEILPPEDSDEEPQNYTTPRPAPLQRFPVIGLRPSTTYTYNLGYEDWSGNTAHTGNHTVTTAGEPDPPKPTVTPTSPEPNSTVTPEDVVVRADWESPESPVVPGSIRMFVDKEPIPPSDLNLGNGYVAYPVPAPLPTRAVSAAVEVTNEQDGEGVARWSFQAQELGDEGTDRATPAAPALAVLALLGAGALARRRVR
jgi:hypothetical protein